MTSSRKRAVVAVVLAALMLPASVVSAKEKWKVFQSKKFGYRAEYPASWHFLSSSLDFLDILSFPASERVEGVVLRKGGAEISVLTQPRTAGSAEEWAQREYGTEQVLAEDSATVENAKPRGCSALKRLVTTDDIMVSAAFYCEADGVVFRTVLTTWKNDPDQGRREAIARRVASSLQSHE